MINYKLEINNLEKIVFQKNNEAKVLRSEISKLNEKISEYKKLYEENNKGSIEANEILGNYNRQTLSEIVLFFIDTYIHYGQGRPKSILNKLDIKEAIKDVEFFNQAIIAIGKPTIEHIFKYHDGVGIDENGNTCLIVKHRQVNNKNLGDRLFSKLTKKSFEDYIIRQGYVK